MATHSELLAASLISWHVSSSQDLASWGWIPDMIDDDITSDDNEDHDDILSDDLADHNDDSPAVE